MPIVPSSFGYRKSRETIDQQMWDEAMDAAASIWARDREKEAKWAQIEKQEAALRSR